MKRTALFLDFDGTLAPIMSHPDDVRLPYERIRRLVDLATRIPTIVLSGRSLPDLAKRLPLPSLAGVSGDHGSTRIFRGRMYIPDAAHDAGPALRRLSKTLKDAFQTWTGIYVEEKEYSLSVHFRNLDPGRVDLFRRTLSHFVGLELETGTLIESLGKCVWEYRPPGLDKEDAMGWYLGELHREVESRDEFLPVMIGDDTTDWEAVKRAARSGGMGYWVGNALPEGDASAIRLLKTPDDVWRLLESF